MGGWIWCWSIVFRARECALHVIECYIKSLGGWNMHRASGEFISQKKRRKWGKKAENKFWEAAQGLGHLSNGIHIHTEGLWNDSRGIGMPA